MLRLYIGLAVLGGLGIAIWLYGNSQYEAGQRDLLKQVEKARAVSVKEKERIDEEIDDLDADELLRRALGNVRSTGR